MKRKVNVLGMEFDDINAYELLKALKSKINRKKKTFVVTANPEIVMHARKDSEYRNIVSQADYVIADGTGVILGAKMLRTPLPERVAGFDLMVSLLQTGSKEGWSAYFLGAKPEVIEKTIETVKARYKGLEIAGYHDGYFHDSRSIVKEIKEAQPDLIFVAIGFPRQEKWIYEHYNEFNKGLFIGVGGSFDVLAGAVKRAPEAWQKLHAEWLYRLIQEPSRWRRMLVLPQFVVEVAKVKAGQKKDVT
ncbi:WecB/TagA/CpsF family glycosyltransferase [Bacillus massilinigeriensis]|uniref:WecB/TagA/CpsF family glycosyltransferase n=1 Tax=Bacillus mediterraneensis TaxID=1805474 RepID=UPI0008F903A7|nr:WecB/TagA/CpsF family glycosyltransferase [Bacillus mediterraneensis]